MTQHADIPVLLRRKQVEAMTTLSRSRIYVLMKIGEFPAPVRLGSQSVAWLRSDIEAWINQRIKASRSI